MDLSQDSATDLFRKSLFAASPMKPSGISCSLSMVTSVPPAAGSAPAHRPGDHWRARGSRSTPDGSADPECQLTLMNARLVDLLAGGDRRAWPLAGDQLCVDLDLSAENLPAGTRLAVGTAVIEVTAPLHTGCAKFSARFGSPALRFVNSPEGRALRLRGLNARVVEPGEVRPGDAVRRL